METESKSDHKAGLGFGLGQTMVDVAANEVMHDLGKQYGS